MVRDAIVIGGGISGLTAAYDLARAGRTIALVEQRPRLGGLILTERVDGLTIEAGPDALLMQKPAAGALCTELGLPLVSTQPPRTAYVLRGGRLVSLPPGSVLGLPTALRAIIAAGMLSPAGRARLARDLLRPAASPHPDQDDSVGAFVRRRFGDEAVRYLAQPLLGGIHVGDVERLSLRALFPALADADREPGSVLRVLAARRQHARAQPHERSEDPDATGGCTVEAGRSLDADGLFRSIPTGLGTLVDALAQRLPDDALRLGTLVTRIERVEAPRAGAHAADSGRGSATPGDADRDAAGGGGPIAVHLSSGEILTARALVFAVPAYVIADLIAPIDPALAALCRGITYASSASITLAYRRAAVPHALAGSGFVVPRGERETRLLAVSWVTSKWRGRAPDELVMLRAFAGGALDADLLERDDEDLAELAHGDLAALHGIREKPVLRRVYRWWRASPQYEVGHLARLAEIEQRTARHPGLFLTGSAFRGVGLPDNVADARRAAAEVGRWLDRWPDSGPTAKMGD